MKLENQVYDAGHYFQMCQSVSEDSNSDSMDGSISWQVIVIHPDGIKMDDPNNIFIIDHAWTYRAAEAKSALEECEGLLERMCNLMNIKSEGVENNVLIREVLKEMWKYNGTYSMTLGAGSVEKSNIWYVMDEFGSRIQHDGEPNFRVIPFFYQPHKCCYSLLFPVKDASEGDEVTRNYVESPPVDEVTRDAQMLPWFPEDLSDLDLRQEEPPVHFFVDGRLPELLADSPINVTPLPSDKKIKVYTDYEYIKTCLTDSRYEITDHCDEADIIWMATHFNKFRWLAESPQKRVSQFPFESVVTIKDLLAVVSRRCAPEDPEEATWVLPSFCLKRELPQFVASFQRREKCGLDNTWIVKPWNLARGMDHTITNNLNHILRLPSTGPKIAQKYLQRPVLFHREDIDAKVKFDLRFIVLLMSVKPLKVGVYKNFWIRFANKGFELNDFEDTEKHFTVNNYNDSFLLQMFCDDFVRKFEHQYPSQPWNEVRDKIYSMVKQLFEGATKFDEPRGIAHNPQSRSSYGLDLMINWEKDETGVERMQPKLLEVNFNPDCKRACEYYPAFFNDLFNVMFLDKECDTVQIL
ncbi:UNVERIFIED_CONTAM: hypothetical protein GTU68_035232 [Idotea baltica]|nr:hypothetical protein [Idotea baltica]